MEVEVSLNVTAILVATVSGFVVGGLWYSPLLFGNAWMRAAGISEEQVNGGYYAKIFGL